MGTTLEQAIADLQAWLREDDGRDVEIDLGGNSVEIKVCLNYRDLHARYEPLSIRLSDHQGNLDQALTQAIIKALNAVRN